MHYSVLALAALVATSSAHAVKLNKRKTITVTKYVDVWTTVTVYGTAPSAAAIDDNTRNGIDRYAAGRRRSSSVKASATPSAAPAAPSVVKASAAPSVAPAAPSVVAAPSAAPQAPSSVKVVVQAPAPSTVPTTPAPASGGSYQDTVLYHHNVHRANHSAPDLAWSQALADTALKIAQTCSYGHSTSVDGGGYGQNIAAGKPVSDIAFVISEQFYNGEVGFYTSYGQAQPSDFDANFKKYGHFTAVVWASTKTVGCASVDCSKTGLANVGAGVPPVFHVCNYGPSGNVIGQFDKNVLPSLNQPTVHG